MSTVNENLSNTVITLGHRLPDFYITTIFQLICMKYGHSHDVNIYNPQTSNFAQTIK